VALLPIVLAADEDPVLVTKAIRVPRVDDTIRRLMDDMVETMIDAHGAGLAAPQVGVPLRVIVLKVDNQVYQLANPEMVRCEGEQTGLEGCLSVPGLIGEVTRCQRVVALPSSLVATYIYVQPVVGAALAAKRGERSKSTLKGASKQMAKSMSQKQLRDFAKTKRKKLPKKKGR